MQEKGCGSGSGPAVHCLASGNNNQKRQWQSGTELGWSLFRTSQIYCKFCNANTAPSPVGHPREVLYYTSIIPQPVQPIFFLAISTIAKKSNLFLPQIPCAFCILGGQRRCPSGSRVTIKHDPHPIPPHMMLFLWKTQLGSSGTVLPGA